MREIEMQVRDYWSGVVAEHPVPSAAELMERVASVDNAVASAAAEPDDRHGDDVTLDDVIHRDANNGLTDPSDEQRGEASSVEVLWEDVELPAPSETGRWSGVAMAVAAAILVVVGVVVVADGNNADVVTEPASTPTVTDPVPPAGESDTGPPPSVTDSLGYQWSRVPDESGAIANGDTWIRSVVAGGPGFVAVGSDNDWAAVWTSPDGVAWSRVPHDDAIFNSGRISSVVVGGPGLVAVGYFDEQPDLPVGVGGGGDAAVWTSPDGVAWSRVSQDEAVFGGPGHQWMSGVTIGGPGLVAVGWDESNGAAVWTSADGIVWSRVPPSDLLSSRLRDSGDSMTAVTAGGPGLVAVGSNNVGDYHASIPAVWTSPDGINWSEVPDDTAFAGGSDGYPRITSVTTGGPGLVAVGWIDGHAAVWTSPDGVAWSRVPHDDRIFGGSWTSMSDVIDVGSGLIAVGVSHGQAAVWTSPDGVAWSRVPHDEALFGAPISPDQLGQAADRGLRYGMAAVTAGPSGLVAVGLHGTNGYPFDAVVWVAEPEN